MVIFPNCIIYYFFIVMCFLTSEGFPCNVIGIDKSIDKRQQGEISIQTLVAGNMYRNLLNYYLTNTIEYLFMHIFSNCITFHSYIVM